MSGAGGEKVMVDVPAAAASVLRDAVATGEYASIGDAIADALEESSLRRGSEPERLAALRTDIAVGSRDAAEGRVEALDIRQVMESGRTLSRGRSNSA